MRIFDVHQCALWDEMLFSGENAKAKRQAFIVGFAKERIDEMDATLRGFKACEQVRADLKPKAITCSRIGKQPDV
jgi:hypothetical protein